MSKQTKKRILDAWLKIKPVMLVVIKIIPGSIDDAAFLLIDTVIQELCQEEE